MNKVRNTIAVVAFLSFSALTSADTLLNKKTGLAVGVGTATIENQTIHWHPCFAASPTNYSAKQYTVVRGNNCIPPAALPKTGSSLPLIGTLGFVFFASGLVMAVRRSKARPIHFAKR